ncbi:hypothetical protein Salat_2547600 [Sesamum alatum]|uniref:Uncharacterized protein n=1 Tax=Sesamum alatum TaxID=300844 RepID=A0AAE1XSK7_9LAMI|nr:hypothetical protein Salat_2547600 [Sesamum alatum]
MILEKLSLFLGCSISMLFGTTKSWYETGAVGRDVNTVSGSKTSMSSNFSYKDTGPSDQFGNEYKLESTYFYIQMEYCQSSFFYPGIYHFLLVVHDMRIKVSILVFALPSFIVEFQQNSIMLPKEFRELTQRTMLQSGPYSSVGTGFLSEISSRPCMRSGTCICRQASASALPHSIQLEIEFGFLTPNQRKGFHSLVKERLVVTEPDGAPVQGSNPGRSSGGDPHVGTFMDKRLLEVSDGGNIEVSPWLERMHLKK